MTTILVMADNLFSAGLGGQYPAHTVSAEEEPAGYEAWRVGTTRRDPLDKATASTANSAWWLRCVFDRLRAHNCIVIDRGHNLAGETWELRSTVDATDFTGTYETLFDITHPSFSMPGAIDNGIGVVTEEGAWIKRYPLRVGKAVELYIDAMGAGIKPELVNVWVGLAVEVGGARRPYDQDSHEMVSLAIESESGWTGRARRTRRRRGNLTVRLGADSEYEYLIREQVTQKFGDGLPMWIVPDTARAEQMFLATRAEGVMSYPHTEDSLHRDIVVEYVEHEPKPF